MAKVTFLTATLKEYVNKKFLEGVKIIDTNKGYSIGNITLETAKEIQSYTLIIEPGSPEELVVSAVIMPIDGHPVMEHLAQLHHAQEYSHIADAVKKLI